MSEMSFTVMQVAKATGLSAHTLRYYERIGLIHPVDRRGNTHRKYSQQDIDWIHFLLRLRATGMSISDMQRYAHLQRQGDATLPERVEMLEKLHADLEKRIETLHDHLEVIQYKVSYYREVFASQSRENTVNPPVSEPAVDR